MVMVVVVVVVVGDAEAVSEHSVRWARVGVEDWKDMNTRLTPKGTQDHTVHTVQYWYWYSILYYVLCTVLSGIYAVTRATNGRCTWRGHLCLDGGALSETRLGPDNSM